MGQWPPEEEEFGTNFHLFSSFSALSDDDSKRFDFFLVLEREKWWRNSCWPRLKTIETRTLKTKEMETTEETCRNDDNNNKQKSVKM